MTTPKPDLIFVNTAGYGGTPRRGPYELRGHVDHLVRSGFAAEFVDIQDEVGRGSVPYPRGHVAAVASRLAASSAEVYVLNIRTTTGPWAHAIAQSLKRLSQGCCVVAYAPRIEERVARLMERDDAFDAILPSDPLVDVAATMKNMLQRKFDIVRRRATDPQPESPAYIIDPATAWLSPDKSLAAVHVGRGCPERCTFCAAPLGVGAVPRYASGATVADAAQRAFDQLDPQQRQFVMLEAENLTSNRGLLRDIIGERQRQGWRFKWGAYARIDDIDPELIETLAAGGCRFLFFGIETSSSRLLRILGKRYDPQIVLPLLEQLHAHGIMTHSSLMFALPEETRRDFEETIRLAEDITWRGGFVDLSPLRIEAGTPMERITRGRALRLLTNSELYRDLLEDGISPESCDPIIAYRMYALDMEDYDVDKAYLAARRVRHALIHAPLSMYCLRVGCGLRLPDLLHRAVDCEPVDAETQWLDDIIETLPTATAVFVRTVHRVECRGRVDEPSLPATEIAIHGLYERLRREPGLLPSLFGLDWWGDRNVSRDAHASNAATAT